MLLAVFDQHMHLLLNLIQAQTVLIKKKGFFKDENYELSVYNVHDSRSNLVAQKSWDNANISTVNNPVDNAINISTLSFSCNFMFSIKSRNPYKLIPDQISVWWWHKPYFVYIFLFSALLYSPVINC